MKFQTGDKVVVRHSNEDAEVVEIINDKMVLVDVRGVKFPAYIDQLDFPYFKMFSEKKQATPPKPKTYIDQVAKEKKPVSAKYPPGVWLMFLPKFDTDEFGDEIVTSLKVHLLNGTDLGYEFRYGVNYFGRVEFDLKNQLFANKDFYLHDIPFSDLNDNPVFEIEWSLLTPMKGKATHYETSLKLKPKQLFTRIEEIKTKGESTFSYKLFDDYPAAAAEEKFELSPLAAAGYKIYEASRARQHLPPAKEIVDLHIEQLISGWQQMSNFEILSLQLKEFEKQYDIAVAHRLASQIVIHGVGSGRLRDEIHERLKGRKEVRFFVNQYHRSFGYGATEIYFQY